MVEARGMVIWGKEKSGHLGKYSSDHHGNEKNRHLEKREKWSFGEKRKVAIRGTKRNGLFR